MRKIKNFDAFLDALLDYIAGDLLTKHSDPIDYTAYVDEEGTLSFDWSVTSDTVDFLSLEPDDTGEWWYVDMETGQTRPEWIAGCLGKDSADMEEEYRKDRGYDDEDDEDDVDDVDPDDFVQWVMKDDDIADIIYDRLHELARAVIINSGWVYTIEDKLRDALKSLGWEC